VRLGRWKAVRYGTDQPAELYDLASDPTETRDVAREHPDTVAALTHIMNTSHTPSPNWPVN
jgi:arylsulfatase A-like enzyme